MRRPFPAISWSGTLLFAAWLGLAPATATAQFSISRFTIDGGGVTHSVGGSFTLGGTIGQPDAGRLSGSGFTLTGGFWSGGGATVTAIGEEPGNVNTHLVTANSFVAQVKTAAGAIIDSDFDFCVMGPR